VMNCLVVEAVLSSTIKYLSLKKIIKKS